MSYTGPKGETPATAKQIPTGYRASSRPYQVHHGRPKGFLSAAQLGHRELQRAGLTLHLFRLVAVAPADPLPFPSPIVGTTQKCRRLGFAVAFPSRRSIDLTNGNHWAI